MLKNLVLSAVTNPVTAVAEANFIAILVWAVALGIMLRNASDTTRQGLRDLSDAISGIVRGVIRLAPLGIFGLVANTLAESGLDALLGYVHRCFVHRGSLPSDRTEGKLSWCLAVDRQARMQEGWVHA